MKIHCRPVSILVGVLPITAKIIKEETEKDIILRKIVKYLKSDSWPKNVDLECKP